MADNSTFIKLGIAGAVGYYAYTQGWLSFLGLTPGATSTAAPAPGQSSGASPGGVTPPPQPPVKNYPSLSVLFAKMVQRSIDAYHGPNCGAQPTVGTISIPGAGQIPNPQDLVALANWQKCQGDAAPLFTMDDWNAFVADAGGPNPMPDPMQAFPGMDRSTKMPALQYWAGMAPILSGQGLSGYQRSGRNPATDARVYSGLSGLARQYRRAS